jgi:hypothetical protein
MQLRQESGIIGKSWLAPRPHVEERREREHEQYEDEQHD